MQKEGGKDRECYNQLREIERVYQWIEEQSLPMEHEEGLLLILVSYPLISIEMDTVPTVCVGRTVKNSCMARGVRAMFSCHVHQSACGEGMDRGE